MFKPKIKLKPNKIPNIKNKGSKNQPAKTIVPATKIIASKHNPIMIKKVLKKAPITLDIAFKTKISRLSQSSKAFL